MAERTERPYDYNEFFVTALDELWHHGMGDLFINIASDQWWLGKIYGNCECESFEFQAESRGTADPEIMFQRLSEQITKWLEGKQGH